MPNLIAYDPAFAFEVATIVEEGLRRFSARARPEMFYLTLYNEGYPMPPRPEAATREAILRGAYRLPAADGEGAGGPDRPGQRSAEVSLMASGPIVREALRARAARRAVRSVRRGVVG